MLRYQWHETKVIVTIWNDEPTYILYREWRNRIFFILLHTHEDNYFQVSHSGATVVQRYLFCMHMSNQVRKAQSSQSIMNWYAW